MLSLIRLYEGVGSIYILWWVAVFSVVLHHKKRRFLKKTQTKFYNHTHTSLSPPLKNIKFPHLPNNNASIRLGIIILQ
jgi:hypothetical protein